MKITTNGGILPGLIVRGSYVSSLIDKQNDKAY